MTVLEVIQRQLDQADEWEEAAKNLRRFDPEDPKANVLEICAEEIREIAEIARPRWVPLTTVQEWSRWSPQTLRKRCREEWEPAGEARLDSSGRWEVVWDRALKVPRKKETPSGRKPTPEEFVDDLWRRTG